MTQLPEAPSDQGPPFRDRPRRSAAARARGLVLAIVVATVGGSLLAPPAGAKRVTDPEPLATVAPAKTTCAKDPACARWGKRLVKRVEAAEPPTAKRARADVLKAYPAWSKRKTTLEDRAAAERGKRMNPLRTSATEMGGMALMTADAPVTGIASDEFNSAALDTSLWTVVDPIGDASITMTGAEAQIAVPGGVRHDLWTGVDEVPRLIQAAPDADFEVQAKWNTAVGAAYQLQGILVTQDSDDMLRIETLHDGDGTRLFVARIADGTASVVHYGDVAGGAPSFLRLKRVGSTYTLRTSTNGTSWTTAATFTQNLAVTGIGPYAGNSGSVPPAFSSRIDHFRSIVPTAPDTTAPSITGVTTEPNGVGATISWQTNEPASSGVVYGLDATYAGGGEVGRNDLVTAHAVTVGGLKCATTYHYAVRSRDAAGNLATGGDRTFTTTPCPTAITSDEFDGVGLNRGLWSFVDPLGDGAARVAGGHAELALPAGTRHDLWTSVDEVQRLVQAAPNADFEVEAKWSSAPQTAYQLQGILVAQDADDMLRIETHHDGVGTRLFVARIANGSAAVVHEAGFEGGPPVYFRLKRQGNDFTLRTSRDGESWTVAARFTQALEVTAIGPFAGNSGAAPPAFTSRIDYFRNIPPDRTPPVISSVTTQPSGAAARVTWSTDEPATSEIRYGTTTAYEAGTDQRLDLKRQHDIALHGFACNTLYHYEIRSRDAEGNTAASGDRTFTTGPCPAHLSSDEFDGTALNSNVWTLVDPVGDAGFAMGGGRAGLSVPVGVRHDIWTGANEAPRLLQAAPNADFEAEMKFDSKPVAAYQMQGVVVEQDIDDLLRIEVHHDGLEAYLFVAAIKAGVASVVEQRPVTLGASTYLRVRRVGSSWGVSYSRDGEAWLHGSSFKHELAVTGVGPFAGNSGGSPPAFAAQVDYFRETTDRTPPVITDLKVEPRSTSAVVTWTTDEPSNSTVDYGKTTAYGQAETESAPRTRHWMRVPALPCATAHNLRVQSVDALGNKVVSGNQSFATAACGNATAPDIDVWGGDNLTFGAAGIPQRWVNVTGNVYDPDGIRSLRGTLNGRDAQGLTLGPDGARLQRAGDFNLELNRDLLFPGSNEVVLTATDTAGNVSNRTVTIDWLGESAGAPPSASGPVLVVVAHGDDALLGAAGIIRRHEQAGRRVVVAAATNGDEPQSGTLSGYCEAAPGDASTTAARGLQLSRETMTAVGLLNLQYSRDLTQTELIFLGYPNHGLVPIVEAGGAEWNGGGSGLRRTYGEDDDGSVATCNGELRHLLDGRHSRLTATDLAADFDALLRVTAPTDIYTLVDFDGHPDHAEVARQTAASVKRLGISARVHGTVVHPHESEHCMGFSAANWPNPAAVSDDPLARFTPTVPFTAPPTPTCSAPTGTGWGPLGPPNESVDVPAEMQVTNPQSNLKWRTLNVWDSQCPVDDPAHVTCGYFNAFAKKNEIFWTRTYTGQRKWPAASTVDWSTGIANSAQVVEGDWMYDAGTDGARPLATGYDRILTLGQFDWRGYEVTVPVKVHSFEGTGSSGIGVGLGWQGHTPYGGLQPRQGHPYGGLCGFGRSFADGAPPRLELIRNNSEVEDTIMAAESTPRGVELGAAYTMRFRRVELANGSSRYSCKFWRGAAEPGAWDLTVDLPDQLATSSRFRGSAYLLAHNADVTFGDVRIEPLAP